MWDGRFARFPEHTPVNKEYYLLRSIFEERFPSAAALHTVPKGLSVACSTPEAVCWDPTWANLHDISGRAVAFHDASDSYIAAAEMAPSAENGVGAPNARAVAASAVKAQARKRSQMRLSAPSVYGRVRVPGL
jgi:hypothetical protein